MRLLICETLKNGKVSYLKTYENCTIIPSVGNCIVVNNEVGKVSDVVINYDTNEVYVYMSDFYSSFKKC